VRFLSDKLKSAAADQIELIVISATRHLHKHTQSPIEALMLEALITYQYCMSGRIPKIMVEKSLPFDGAWTITPQAHIGSFRVDFLIEDAETGVKVVLECDGHDFHERTKEQARKDRSRDRELQAKGFLVLRYTGSEIWRDPWKCAEDVEYKMYSKMFSDGENSK